MSYLISSTKMIREIYENKKLFNLLSRCWYLSTSTCLIIKLYFFSIMKTNPSMCYYCLRCGGNGYVHCLSGAIRNQSICMLQHSFSTSLKVKCYFPSWDQLFGKQPIIFFHNSVTKSEKITNFWWLFREKYCSQFVKKMKIV